MILTYFLTVLITGVWIIRMFEEKTFIFKRTPLDIPLILFLSSQIISTIISIDPHTSVYGYYSRSNGGLLSIISYTMLYWALVSNLDKNQAINLIKSGLVGGLLVSLWAIPEHFGISPSCVILRDEFNASCWIQDVQARVFATLGQPNWLAAYLAMLIFPALYFFLKAKSIEEKIFAYSFLGSFYLAFTFTYSRGATFGLIAGLMIFVVLDFARTIQVIILRANVVSREVPLNNFRPLIFILLSFLSFNLLFGSAFTRFELSKVFNSPESKTQTEKKVTTLTQLENGGTESGQIRLIVWQGALDIFKHYPLFGSGVETFAYAYYQFRPTSHNLVSEWDFLYNKAHNEYLNYLATTGIFGFGSYMMLIATFLITSIKHIVESIKQDKNSESLYTCILASYISYLVQNIFGFSVVIIALFFFLFPGIFYILSDSTKDFNFWKKLYPIPFTLYPLLSRPLLAKWLQAIVVIVMLFFVVQVYLLWYADTFFAQGQRNSEAGKPGTAYNYLSQAAIYNDKEPYYKSELGYAASAAAASFYQEDATLSATLKQQAIAQTNKALEISPKNVSFYRTAILTNYNLSTIDPSFMEKTLQIMDKTIELAPTDPKLLYNKAVILGQIDKNQEAIENLNKAIAIKKNYREAYIALALFLFDGKKYPEAVDNMKKVLQLVPSDGEAMKYLNDWGKEGVATTSAQQK